MSDVDGPNERDPRTGSDPRVSVRPSMPDRIRGRPALALLCLLLAPLAGCRGRAPESRELTVFAAASLRDLLTEIGAGFESRTGVETVFNFAGSNVLALQIEASRRADVFVSASDRWMDYVEERGLLEPGSRRVFLSNRLAVIVQRGSGVEIRELGDLARADYRFLSIADPEAVPAGRYARELLSGVEVDGGDLWTRLVPRLAPAPDVRAALGLVEARPDVVGMVYLTDALSSTGVEVALVAAGPEAPRIRYSAALARGAPATAGHFLDYLGGAAAAAVIDAHGFERPAEHG